MPFSRFAPGLHKRNIDLKEFGPDVERVYKRELSSIKNRGIPRGARRPGIQDAIDQMNARAKALGQFGFKSNIGQPDFSSGVSQGTSSAVNLLREMNAQNLNAGAETTPEMAAAGSGNAMLASLLRRRLLQGKGLL